MSGLVCGQKLNPKVTLYFLCVCVPLHNWKCPNFGPWNWLAHPGLPKVPNILSSPPKCLSLFPLVASLHEVKQIITRLHQHVTWCSWTHCKYIMSKTAERTRYPVWRRCVSRILKTETHGGWANVATRNVVLGYPAVFGWRITVSKKVASTKLSPSRGQNSQRFTRKRSERSGSHRLTHIASDLDRSRSPNRRHSASLDLKKQHADFSHRRPTPQDFRRFFGFGHFPVISNPANWVFAGHGGGGVGNVPGRRRVKPLHPPMWACEIGTICPFGVFSPVL